MQVLCVRGQLKWARNAQGQGISFNEPCSVFHRCCGLLNLFAFLIPIVDPATFIFVILRIPVPIFVSLSLLPALLLVALIALDHLELASLGAPLHDHLARAWYIE
jgi:hypothetical protein